MNSQDRREGRYQRRKAKRNKPGKDLRLEDVYTMQNFHEATNLCKNGVMWKQDPINYTCHSPVNNKRIKDDLLAGRFPKSGRIRCKDIHERGKVRHIKIVEYKSRVMQRCHSDKALLPALTPGLIYDNMACQEGRGTSRARKRVVCHLERAIRENGVENTYVLTTDFSKFFDSIPHRLCLETLNRAFSDKRIIGLTMRYIKQYHQPEIDAIKDPVARCKHEALLKRNLGNGCTLGSEISQIMGMSTLSPLDHAAKEEIRAKHYVRYNDDIIAFGPKNHLELLLKKIDEMCKKFGFRLNGSKTKIQKVTKQFKFLKVRYFVTETGKIIRRLSKDNIADRRQKLKKYHNLVNEGRMSFDDVYDSMQAWLAHCKGTKSWHAQKRMIDRYCVLFDGYRKEELVS